MLFDEDPPTRIVIYSDGDSHALCNVISCSSGARVLIVPACLSI
ncbi:hypothetical protein NC653_028797 [Populus alba x Populus x berolinensis]|uniref:Uncharacterized protein n=1 Tax=Populus alba x Populus x berolinensis TaxID=444605 RepID=A0AAD6M0N0_9ROSI|nr:hypothetical protein NC653_028797 [Populus alba x Populus x berolinensis]